MLNFKIADTKEEFEQIFRLNYATFVEEIPQHQQNESHKLVDKFHNENYYIICKDDSGLVAMVAYRDKRPFSLDQKLPDLDKYLPSDKQICEVRLLSVKKEYRRSRVVPLMAYHVLKYALKKNCDFVIVSSIEKQEKFYRHIGFVPFAHSVYYDQMKFQPMIVDTATMNLKYEKNYQLYTRPSNYFKRSI